MQIGGAELRDNIAFLPWSSAVPPIPLVQRSSDHHGLVREDGEWKLLSLGLLLLDFPRWSGMGCREVDRRKEKPSKL